MLGADTTWNYWLHFFRVSCMTLLSHDEEAGLVPYSLYYCATAVVRVHDLLLPMRMAYLVLLVMAKGHKLIQQPLHSTIRVGHSCLYSYQWTSVLILTEVFILALLSSPFSTVMFTVQRKAMCMNSIVFTRQQCPSKRQLVSVRALLNSCGLCPERP